MVTVRTGEVRQSLSLEWFSVGIVWRILNDLRVVLKHEYPVEFMIYVYLAFSDTGAYKDDVTHLEKIRGRPT